MEFMGFPSKPETENPPAGSQDLLFAEVLAYRELLLREVDVHRKFSRVTILTGLGLLVGGLVVAYYYYSALGWLLTIVGLLRSLNSFYDFQRGDELQKRLRLVEQKFRRQ